VEEFCNKKCRDLSLSEVIRLSYKPADIELHIRETDVVDRTAITVVSVTLKDRRQGNDYKRLEKMPIYIYINKMFNKFLA
jgi:hypothetical protein